MKSAPDRDKVIEALRTLQPELAQLGVEHMYLFGSVARNEAREDSDVDLFVDHRKPGFDLFDLVTVKHVVERFLGRTTDVTTRASLHPALKNGIERGAISVF